MPQSIRVLHVDDDPDRGDLTATFLEREDNRFAVQTTTSAAAALESIADRPPDCIVSDYEMSGRNGIELLEAVRDERSEMPFILFTGKGSEEVASKAISAGVTDYLEKKTGTDQYALLANRIQNAVERVRAERQRERQLRAIETAQEGISILDEDGRYLYVNEAFAELHGYGPDEMLGEHWELAYPDEDVSRVRRDVLPEVERAGYWHGETTSRRADGTTVDVDHTLAATDRGELVCTVRDVSERKQREEAIRRSAARLEALFENSPDMVTVHDSAGTIIDPNPRLCEKTGYDAETLTGMKIWELDRRIDPEEAQALWERMEVGDRHRLEGAYRRPDGSTFPVEVHIRRLDLAGEDAFVAISRDVTEKKRTERKRKQIISRTNDAVVEVGPEWQITLVNGQTEAFSGRTESELLGSDFWAAFPEARETRFEKTYRRAMETRTEASIVDHYSGVDEWFDVHVYPNEDGGLAFYFRRVTEYKRRQRELQRTERRYRAIFEDPNILAGILDTDGTLLEQNQTAIEYVDADVEDVVGKPFWETPWWPESLQPAIREKVEQAADGDYATYEADLLKPDGDPYNVSGVIRPVTDEDGETVSLVVSARDVTERKRRERDLEKLTSQYQALVNNFPDGGVFLFDEDLRYVRAGGDELSSVGLSSADFEGKTPHDLFPEAIADETEAHNRETLSGEEQTYRQTYHSTRYEIRTMPIRDDAGAVIYGMAVSRDVTEQTEQKRALERQNERLEEFASVVSHDLRNPLQIAAGRLELARDECDSAQLDAIGAALDRSEALIQDLSTLARTGDTVGELEAVSVPALAEACWQVTPNDDATLVVETDRTVSVDRSRFRQLLENLFGNAVEHGGSNPTVTIGDVEDGIYVADDGTGVPDNEREAIFAAGYSTSDEGTGFGLRIAEQVATAHGWEIRVTDSDDGGARFDITGIEPASDRHPLGRRHGRRALSAAFRPAVVSRGTRTDAAKRDGPRRSRTPRPDAGGRAAVSTRFSGLMCDLFRQRRAVSRWVVDGTFRTRFGPGTRSSCWLSRCSSRR